MKKVLFRGPVLTQSGYGVHARQIARWLLERKDLEVAFAATQWGDTPWILNHDEENGLIGKIMTRTTKPESFRADVSIQLQLPNEWDPKLAPKNVGVSAVVETDKCHPDWARACNQMDLVIVPSQHAKQCLKNSGHVAKEIMVVPESFNDALLADSQVRLEDYPTSFNFLVFGQITGNNPENDRKNLFYTIKWLCEAFKDDKDVGIVLKTNAGRNTKIDRKMVETIIGNLLSTVRKGSSPKVYLCHGDMPAEDIAALYKHPQIKALVSLTRGEGYGLPTLEAAASGLPVIATGWSGHLDFLNKGKFINVSYQLNEVHPSRIDNTIFVKGARWANPSEEDFKKKVVKFRHNSDIPRQWANDLQQKIKSMYSFEQVAKTYDIVLEGIV